jgi:hypothetical protein
VVGHHPLRRAQDILAARGRGGLIPGQQSQGDELGSAPWGAKGPGPDSTLVDESAGIQLGDDAFDDSQGRRLR